MTDSKPTPDGNSRQRRHARRARERASRLQAVESAEQALTIARQERRELWDTGERNLDADRQQQRIRLAEITLEQARIETVDAKARGRRLGHAFDNAMLAGWQPQGREHLGTGRDVVA